MPLFEEKDEYGEYVDSHVLTLHIVPPGELHLLLGTNHIFHELCKVWSDAEKWASKCNVFRQGRSQEFNGNGCNTLLEDKSLDILESMIPFPSVVIMGYAQTFRLLSKVVKGCFSWTVAPTIKNDIERFKESYLKLNITVTPKMHIIFVHVLQYLEHKAAVSDGNWTGLTVETEQPFEAVHHDFSKRWKTFKVAKDNGKYKSSLHRAVCCYNALNVETFENDMKNYTYQD